MVVHRKPRGKTYWPIREGKQEAGNSQWWDVFRGLPKLPHKRMSLQLYICHIQGHQCHISTWISRETFIYCETGEAEIQLESRGWVGIESRSLSPFPVPSLTLPGGSPAPDLTLGPCSGLPLASARSVGQRASGHKEHAHLGTGSPLLDHTHTRDSRILCPKAPNVLSRPVQASSPLSAPPWMDCVPTVYPGSVTAHGVSVHWNRGRTRVFTLGQPWRRVGWKSFSPGSSLCFMELWSSEILYSNLVFHTVTKVGEYICVYVCLFNIYDLLNLYMIY